jgi:hypothetical protein
MHFVNKLVLLKYLKNLDNLRDDSVNYWKSKKDKTISEKIE